MTRLMKMFVLGMALTACRTAQFAPDPVMATRPEYEEFLKACDAKKDSTGQEYNQCLIQAQAKYIKTLEAGQQAPRRQPAARSSIPAVVGTQLPPGYVPVVAQRIFATTDRPSVGEGVTISYLQNGTYPVIDPTLVACAWTDAGYLEVQGSGRIGVYLDTTGSTKAGVLGVPRFCARADAGLTFHNVPRNGRVRVLYARPTTNMVGAYPVYQVVVDKTYDRGERPGFTAWTGMDGR